AAAVAGHGRVRVDAGVGVHVDPLCIGNVRVGALVVAADADLAAAHAAAGVDLGAGQQRHALAQDVYAATLAGGTSGHDAAVDQGVAAAQGLQHDLAAFLRDRAGLHEATVLERVRENCDRIALEGAQ